MIRSAVAGNEELLPLSNRQIYFALVGIVLIFLVAAIDYRYWMALYRPIAFVMSLFLFALFLSAQEVFGAARWFQVGVLFVQPTEFAKIVAILLLARYFDRTQNQPRDLRWIVGAFLWVMGLGIWILLQPNLSNVVVLMVILASLLWFNGIQLKHILMFGTIGVIAIATIVTLSALNIRIPFMQVYQQERIANFILPDPNATFGATYNVQQALIAIGSGGLFGKGYGPLFKGSPYRFYLLRHLGGIWFGWKLACHCNHCPRRMEMFARRAKGARCSWDDDCLWSRNTDLFSGDSQYRRESKRSARIRVATAIHQLWW
jgi:rod shape determining protein RodA